MVRNITWRRWKRNFRRHLLIVWHLIRNEEFKKCICSLLGRNSHYLWPKCHNMSANIRWSDDVNLTQLINIALHALHALTKKTKCFLENIRRPNPSEVYKRLSGGMGRRSANKACKKRSEGKTGAKTFIVCYRSRKMNTREIIYYSHTKSSLAMVCAIHFKTLIGKVLVLKQVSLVRIDLESFDRLKSHWRETWNFYQDINWRFLFGYYSWDFWSNSVVMQCEKISSSANKTSFTICILAEREIFWKITSSKTCTKEGNGEVWPYKCICEEINIL